MDRQRRSYQRVQCRSCIGSRIESATILGRGTRPAATREKGGGMTWPDAPTPCPDRVTRNCFPTETRTDRSDKTRCARPAKTYAVAQRKFFSVSVGIGEVVAPIPKAGKVWRGSCPL